MSASVSVKMVESPKKWEGEACDGFPLRQYVGGGNHPVFVTEYKGRKATIKLIALSPKELSAHMGRLPALTEFSDSHLIRTFATGHCLLSGQKMLYVVTEFADEDLSQVLPSRALTASEATEMLSAVARGLTYLHGAGLVHGHIKPANIMVVDEQIKLSTDWVSQAGTASPYNSTPSPYTAPEAGKTRSTKAADMWSLGMVLVEAATQQLPKPSDADPVIPASIPEPLQHIARNCLRRDPAERWTAEQIAAYLRQVSATEERPAAPAKSFKGVYAVAIMALIAAAMFMAMRVWRQAPGTQPAGAPINAAVSVPAGVSATAPSPTTSSTSAGAVLHEVIPDVPKSARNTVHGIIKVRVAVDVDQDGHVSKTRMESPGSSKYFARLAMEASPQWTFTPPTRNGEQTPSRWILRYEFTRGDPRAQASPAGR